MIDAQQNYAPYRGRTQRDPPNDKSPLYIAAMIAGFFCMVVVIIAVVVVISFSILGGTNMTAGTRGLEGAEGPAGPRGDTGIQGPAGTTELNNTEINMMLDIDYNGLTPAEQLAYKEQIAAYLGVSIDQVVISQSYPNRRRLLTQSVVRFKIINMTDAQIMHINSIPGVNTSFIIYRFTAGPVKIDPNGGNIPQSGTNVSVSSKHAHHICYSFVPNPVCGVVDCTVGTHIIGAEGLVHIFPGYVYVVGCSIIHSPIRSAHFNTTHNVSTPVLQPSSGQLPSGGSISFISQNALGVCYSLYTTDPVCSPDGLSCEHGIYVSGSGGFISQGITSQFTVKIKGCGSVENDDSSIVIASYNPGLHWAKDRVSEIEDILPVNDVIQVNTYHNDFKTLEEGVFLSLGIVGRGFYFALSIPLETKNVTVFTKLGQFYLGTDGYLKDLSGFLVYPDIYLPTTPNDKYHLDISRNGELFLYTAGGNVVNKTMKLAYVPNDAGLNFYDTYPFFIDCSLDKCPWPTFEDFPVWYYTETVESGEVKFVTPYYNNVGYIRSSIATDKNTLYIAGWTPFY